MAHHRPAGEPRLSPGHADAPAPGRPPAPGPQPLGDGIVALPLPTHFAVGRVNLYLLEDDPLTLVDAGPRSQVALEELEAMLAARGHRVEDIGLILLTHQHEDHSGLTATLVERSGAAVAGLGLLADTLADREALAPAEEAYLEALMRLHGVPSESAELQLAILEAWSRFAAGVRVGRRLRDGELVELGGRSLRALHRPGHSPTDTLFVDEGAGVAFVGDHLIAHISSNPVAHRPLEGSDDPAERPPALARYLDSLRRTAAMGPLRLLPGHGEPIEDGPALVAERVAHHRERCDLVAEIVAGGPLSAHRIARAIWGDLALRQALLTLSEVLGHVDLLAEGGRVRWLREGERMLVAPC